MKSRKNAERNFVTSLRVKLYFLQHSSILLEFRIDLVHLPRYQLLPPHYSVDLLLSRTQIQFRKANLITFAKFQHLQQILLKNVKEFLFLVCGRMWHQVNSRHFSLLGSYVLFSIEIDRKILCTMSFGALIIMMKLS